MSDVSALSSIVFQLQVGGAYDNLLVALVSVGGWLVFAWPLVEETSYLFLILVVGLVFSVVSVRNPATGKISLDIVEVDLLPICTSSSMHFSNFGSCNRCSMIQKADQVSQCTDAGYVAVERHFLASCLCTVHGAKRTGLFHGWCSPSMRLEFDLVV